MKSENRFLEIPGFKIGYKTWGNPQSTPILALHGWLDNANSFNLLAPKLQDQYYIIAIDLPGHGLSSYLPPGSYYHFIDGIFILLEIMDALNLKQVHLLGHSMGACLASLVAGVAPERFLSIALIDALGPFSHPEDQCCEQLNKYLKNQQIIIRKNKKPYPSIEAAAQERAQKGYLSYEHALILCERGLSKENDHYYWRHDLRLLVPSPLRMTEGQIISCLQNINCKTCLIRAKEGISFEEQALEGRVKAVKNIQVDQLSGGHHIHMEQPDTVGQYLVKFLQ